MQLILTKKKGRNKKHIANPFELLTENGDDGGDDIADEQQEDEDEDAQTGPAHVSSVTSTKKKKKNKKKKKKGSDVAQAAAAPEEVEDEIEASIQEVNRILGEAGVSSAESRTMGGAEFTVNMKALLNVEYKYVNIVHEHPFHIDSLIQLSEVFRMNEDAQMAVDLIGNCRLDFRRQENSLDPDGDPLCVLLMIDFYALRSEQYSFLLRMFEEWEPGEGNMGGFGEPAGAEGGEEEDGQNNELRRGVGALMDAMRDLLNNIRLAPAPVENGQNPDEDGGGDADGDDGDWE
nr:hypothetical protein BaRGS_021903 [Batillaria attramentaria]